MTPLNRLVAVKEVIQLSKEVVEDRFHLEGGQGRAYEYFGEAVSGMVGSGFIYTNGDSLSVGIGCTIDDFMEQRISPNDLLEKFKAHPRVTSHFCAAARLLNTAPICWQKKPIRTFPRWSPMA